MYYTYTRNLKDLIFFICQLVYNRSNIHWRSIYIKNHLLNSAMKGRGIDKTYYPLSGKKSTRNILEENININFAKSQVCLSFEKGNERVGNVSGRIGTIHTQET